MSAREHYHSSRPLALSPLALSFYDASRVLPSLSLLLSEYADSLSPSQNNFVAAVRLLTSNLNTSLEVSV
jgi:hypothetical protein